MTAATPQPSGDERAVIPEGPTGRRPRSARSDRFERASTASDLDTSLFHWEQRRSHDAAQDIQRLWRGVRARRYVLMLLQRREEEEDEEDAREMDRVVVLKEEEVCAVALCLGAQWMVGVLTISVEGEGPHP